MDKLQFHDMGDGRKIAFRHFTGDGPTLVFLPGYMSDMDGSKATTIFSKAQRSGQSCLLFDYSGCGNSNGTFEEGSLSRWRDEAVHIITQRVAGPVVLIGSSMGGWLMFLVSQKLRNRVAGLVGIAAAPDFTDWGYSEEQKIALASGRSVFEENPYGSEPTPTHSKFWTDAMQHVILDGEINILAPVRLIHGQKDADVPWEVSLQLAEKIRTDDVRITLIKAGEHRLSSEEDLALIEHEIWSLL